VRGDLLALLTFLGFGACRKPPSLDASKAPRNVVVVGPGAEFTVIMGSFTAPRDLRYHDPHCLAVPTHDGAEPVSANAGRLEVWVVGGPILGHVERNGDAMYQTAVRTVLAPGTRVSAHFPGSSEVPAHRFRTSATVPSPIHREHPRTGFVLRAGEGLPVRWSRGEASHVTLTLTLEPSDGRGEGLLITCVVPASSRAFTVPARAIALAPEGVARARLVLVATGRAQEGDFALDVVLVGRDDAEATGTFVR